VNDALSGFLLVWTSPDLFALTALGALAGVYVGAIPGLSVTMAVSILISFTFSWDVDAALALIAGVYMGGVYGGSRSAVLLNVPGGPAAVATAFDGYPLAQRGRAGHALGLATVMSVIGGFVGIALLATAAPAVAEVALRVQPRDYLLIGLLGLLLVGALSGESLSKGVYAAALGVLVGAVGLDPLTAEERLTFGVVDLWAGVPPVAAMIGLFGVAEALRQIDEIDRAAVRQAVARIAPPWASVRRHLPLGLQTSTIGAVVGALPGAGGDVAALLAYDYARRVTRDPDTPFGEGAEEGVVAPESANNAAVGGAYIPMLTLGVPGDAVTAVIIGALFIHGLNPGPLLMVAHPQVFWMTVGALTLANLCVLVFGLGGVRAFVRLTATPKPLLLPAILLLSAVGAYATNNAVADVWWALGFGVLGWAMKRYGYPVAPVVLGVILSGMIDDNWRRAIISENGDFGALLLTGAASPLTLTLAAALIGAAMGRSGVLGAVRRRLSARRG
jgi:putative tricarboxylic transport membrane protein